MKELGIVNVVGYGCPIALLERGENFFVGAFCSGAKKEDLTVKIFNKNNLDNSTYWPRESQQVLRVLEKIHKINPESNQKLKKIMNAHWIVAIRNDLNPNTIRQI